MLKHLLIEQFVIIDKLGLDFQSGLTVLTGETGAGKSILLDAMGLILGDPANREAVRQGANESVIEAIFAPRSGHPVFKFLEDQKLSVDSAQEFTIHRTIARENKDEILVNGKAVELDLLKQLGTYLVEIHGQFANQNLLDPSNQLNLLDLFGAYPPEILKNVADALHEVERLTAALEEEKLFIAKHGHEIMQLDQTIDKLKKLEIRKGIYEEIREKHAVLQTAKETSEVFQSVLANLVATGGAEQALIKSNSILARQKHLDLNKLEKMVKLIASAQEITRAAIDEMTRLAPEYDIDTKPLYKFEEILNALQKIATENEIQPEKLFDFYEQIATKAERIRNARTHIAKLDELLAKAKESYRHHAHILTEKRIEAGKALSTAITAEMPPLKLMRAQFEVQVVEKPMNPWTVLGFNEVTFTARMNPGMPFSPIAETASGGELARMILALKVVLQRVQIISTLVFDEVDTGIGGAAAAAVGERIALLADATQVLVITHSPQVASRGHQHLHVSKKTDGVTTTSVVRSLSLQERTDEISRMLAGDTITAESHAAAKSLIDEAGRAAEIRKEKSKEQPKESVVA